MDYRQILKDKYQERRGRNSSYSLRAYARDLKISASRLNEIMSEKKGLSENAAIQITKALNLNSNEEKIFLLSVESLHSRSALSKRNAFEKLHFELKNLEKDPPKHTTVVHWTAEAVQKLIQRKGFIPNAENIAFALGIPLYLATSPLRFLTRAGFLPGTSAEKAYIANRLKGTRLNVDYEQILELAKMSFMKNQDSNLEHFEHRPLLLAPEDLEKARKIIMKTYHELQRLESFSSKSKLYCFSTQFFKTELERKKQ